MYKVIIGKKEYSVHLKKDEIFVNEKKMQPDIIELKKNKFHILENNKSYSAEVIDFDRNAKTMRIRVNQNIYDVIVKDSYDELLSEMGIDISAGKKVNDIKAPMPGMVLNVMVENGQPIKKGDAIVVLEAMKMENILKAPVDGIIRKIHVVKGDKVEKNQLMVDME